MSFVRRFLFASTLLAILLAWSGRASADPAITGILGAVQLVDKNGVAGANHPSGILINTVNFADCEQDLQFVFQLGITNPGQVPQQGATFQAWAGISTDCTVLTNRQAATATCWPVTQPITPAALTTVVIRAQDIASQIAATTKPVTYTPGTEAACHVQTTTGAASVQITFMFTTSGGNVGNAQPYPVTVDTVAGAVNGPVTVGVGDTLLVVNIPATNTTDPDTTFWNVYRDPPPGSTPAPTTGSGGFVSNGGVCNEAGVPDAGDDGGDGGIADAASDGLVEAAAAAPILPADTADATADAGIGNPCGAVLNDADLPDGTDLSGTGGGGSTSCNSTVLVSGGGSSTVDEAGVQTITGGTQKVIPVGYLAAQVGASSTFANLTGLTNGVTYTIAVAAQDKVGNVGPLAVAACGDQTTPTPVSDFWRQYVLDGGQAGGGFCSVRGLGGAAGSSLFTFGVLGVGIAWVRRRRKKS